MLGAEKTTPVLRDDRVPRGGFLQELLGATAGAVGRISTLRLTNMEVANPLCVKESSRPNGQLSTSM